ncbi:MAG: hypothetical protein JW852_03305 [Spirochaetales bacterium]|nr:hypothetical protein [Spirochaetales bacterium]
MAEYDRFNSLARHISRNARDKTDSQLIPDLHEAFVSCIPQLPENLKHDVAYYFENAAEKAGVENPASFLVEKLTEALYLFEGEHDRIEETFTAADWEYIKEVISDFALEIDQPLLTYIMRRIVSRGLIDR